ncbi:molybdenum cofactor guanylyltransferase [Desulfonatronospira sp. MSAO_Bac3]|uniref:molybdenum cofactor guanylyltransferase n=1 Tax=Desulfonatronospira sp. MSAO_Bac3 TaxID=2293857 RepID=UPI000FED5C52|nr:molybdenum cofactor guanylyltransferase [Desulfonatronospira sp. MSAO_Bac3]RQD75229.1 MAG: molybdenum cofactor guanylyltransferase [Desulfonatronospira sp. MSAO_Bac3]
MTAQDLSAVILAGGKSTRLGRDKTRVRIQGQTLVQRMVSLARRFCRSTWVVGQHPQQVDAPWMLDEIPGIGPMGGIITALKRLSSPCLVLACDLPAMHEDLLARLIAHRSSSPGRQCMTTFMQEQTGYIESLVAVYETRCLDLLLASYEKGCYRLSTAVPPEYRLHIPYGIQEEHFFFNVNYPGDLEKILSEVNPGTLTG